MEQMFSKRLLLVLELCLLADLSFGALHTMCVGGYLFSVSSLKQSLP